MALLQQLALTAKLANGSPTPPPGQTPPPTDVNTPLVSNLPPEPLHSSPRPPQTGWLDVPGDPRYNRNGYPDRARDQRDGRYMRGGARGGFRGRGRWDDHHNHDRFRPRDRDWNSPSHPKRSRSRSPRRHEEQRNVRPRSPPHHPLHDQDLGHQTPTSTHDKDEFGRDLRATSASPSISTSVEDTQALAPMDSSVDPTAGIAADNHIPVSEPLPLVAAGTSAQSTETDTRSPASQQQRGLDRFDVNTFDATSPSSWEALGNLWQTSYGYPPSQEELMQFVMAKSMAIAGIANGGFNGAQGGQWQQGNWEEHGSQYGGGWQGGRGGHTGGQGHGHVTEQSDAIVLNGDYDEQEHGEVQDSSGGGRGGRMRRVGDKWMFVKEES